MTAKKNNPYRKKLSRRELFKTLTGQGKRQEAPEGKGGGGSATADADALFQKHEYAAAANKYRAFLARYPDHEPGRRRLVLCLYRGRELDAAEKLLADMLAKKGSDSFARLYLGLVRARQGDGKGALSIWQKYYNIDQPLIQRELNLILARQEIGETPSSKDLVRDVEQAIAAQQATDADK